MYGIVYMSIPPLTFHKLQPLDVRVFGPFRAQLTVSFNDWHLNHPGQALSIYDIPMLAKLAYLEVFTMKNIISGFTKPGIHPIHRLAFSDDDSAPSSIHSDQEPSDTQQMDLQEPEMLSDGQPGLSHCSTISDIHLLQQSIRQRL
ncbi:hypothetical protein JTB14_021597 [Gonioctena quinquepunctata]|nr:hypothetical protein JTB14_021597 [Gonioctena quinquepunctata]